MQINMHPRAALTSFPGTPQAPAGRRSPRVRASEEAGARNRARIAIFDGLDSASLDELLLVGTEVARIRREHEGADAGVTANAGDNAANTVARTVCAHPHRVAELALRPPSGSAPTYEGGPRVEALTDAERRLRAETILDVMRGLQDRASLVEIIVMSRCLERLEALTKRRQGDLCLLDEALLLEKTDVRLEREHAACAAVIHGEGHCHSGMHQPSCRDDRQAKIFAWTQAAFSIEQATSLPQRGIRLLEEAIEAFQAVGGDPAQAHKLVDFVFSRPVGDLHQELGGVSVCLLALAAAAGLSADAEEQREASRVLAKPVEEFRRRNEAKNAAGFLALTARAWTVTFREGDATWHDGPGWYYTTGPESTVWTGAFPSRVLAEQHARLQGHTVAEQDRAELRDAAASEMAGA
jgi:hypothetical protein